MMLPRLFPLLTTCALLVLLGAGCSSEVEQGSGGANFKACRSTPNMILVLLEDTGFSDLGAYGSEIKTPNIDQLAANGVQFTNFHAAGGLQPDAWHVADRCRKPSRWHGQHD